MCPGCGAPNRAQAKFCGSCGTALAVEVSCPECGTSNPVTQRFCDECGAELRQRPAGDQARANRPPRTLANGRYELGRLLGEGGGKRVFVATDTRLQREVAAALFKAQDSDDTALRRARREAEAMAKLGDHPNVVNVYDIGEEAGQLYLISQYMPGGDLYRLLTDAVDQQLAVEEVIRIGSDIARGLEHAHANGVIHRDVKPQNVWLAPDGTAKIGDFGLAMADGGTRLTAEGAMLGTVAYMAPEQGLGRAADARSDLYSLGALLYELLCGVPPFVGDSTAAVVSQHVSTAPVAPSWHRSGVPAALEQLMLKLLAKSPTSRPRSAADVREGLELIAATATGTDTVDQDVRALDRISDGTFLGRERETQELDGAVDEAVGRRGRCALVTGEAGIGKTRLATEVAAYAGLRGAQVLWGRCYAGSGAPAYWPWVQVIRAYVHDHDPDTLLSDLGPGASEIAQIVSELRERIPDIPEPPQLDAEEARFHLFDSIATFLRNASSKQPLAIFLEDLQQADTPSLMLLAYVARELTTSRVFLLSTYREDELDDEHYLREVMASMSRERGYSRVRLRGLTNRHVAAMLEGVLQQPLEDPRLLDLAAAIHEESDGNPYFVEEIVRHLIDSGALYQQGGRWATDAREGDELGIPSGIREAVAGRLARLSSATRDLLATAAVVGREFDLQLLTRVSGLEPSIALPRLQEAIEAAIVHPAAGDPGRYAFRHGAIRDALYEDLHTDRRADLHIAAGEALETLYEDRIESHLSEVAYHFAKAAPTGDVAKAADYAWWAGERAVSLYAYEDAVTHYETALRLFDTLPDVPQRRCDLLLALGDARWRAGKAEAARKTFTEAAAIAHELALHDHYARAALGYGGGPGGFSVTDQGDEQLIRMLRAALDALPPRDSPLRVRVLARLAVELRYTRELQEADQLSAEAVEMAERVGDGKILVLAIYSRQWSTMGPDRIEEALAAGDDIVRLAPIGGDRDMEFEGHHLRLIALTQLGDFEAVDEEIAACDKLAGELRQPRYQWEAAVFRTMRALMQGRFKEAERLAQTALSFGQRAQQEAAAVVFGAHLFLTRWADGSLEELVDVGREAAERYGQAWPAAYVWLLTEIDREDDARSRFNELAADGFASLRNGGDWLTAICTLSMASLALGDREAARRLYELLQPYADRCTPFLAGAGCLGFNHSFVGFAAQAAGLEEAAIGHFEEALKRNAAIGANFIAPRVCYEYARTLLAKGGDGERGKATELIDAGLAQARRIGMRVDAERLTELRNESQERTAPLGWTALDSVAQSVEQERPDLRPAAAPDGTVTIMFSDIEGSTVLTEKLGDSRWLELLRRHNSVVRRHVAEHGGFEVKSQGDGFMVAFASARNTIRAAIAIQREFAARNQRAGQALRVRIGLHTGEVIREREDFFGKNVILAARIAACARGDEILVSSLVREIVSSTAEFEFGEPREERLKGLSDPQRLYEVRWSSAARAGAKNGGAAEPAGA